jgi:hypothetical protein
MWPSPERQNGTQGRRPSPRGSFSRIPRARFDEYIAAVEDSRDRALAARRAHADWIASYLEQRATAHEADAHHTGTPEDRRHAHRMTAHTLRDLIRDIEEGPAHE